jgi:hypothetical protein
MIEAVNAALSTASSVRAMAEQVTVAESLSANPARIQKVSISAAYLSPHVRLRPDVKPIFVVRDSSTGEAIRQFPTEAQIRAYQRAAQVKDGAVEDSAPELESVAGMESSIQYREIKQIETAPAPVPGEVEAEMTSSEPAPVKTGESFSAEA